VVLKPVSPDTVSVVILADAAVTIPVEFILWEFSLPLPKSIPVVWIVVADPT